MDCSSDLHKPLSTRTLPVSRPHHWFRMRAIVFKFLDGWMMANSAELAGELRCAVHSLAYKIECLPKNNFSQGNKHRTSAIAFAAKSFGNISLRQPITVAGNRLVLTNKDRGISMCAPRHTRRRMKYTKPDLRRLAIHLLAKRCTCSSARK